MARLLEIAKGAEVSRIVHHDQVLAVAFDREGGRLVTASGREASFILLSSHLVHTEDVVKDTCGRLTHNLTRSEWKQYIGAEPYRATCPSLTEPQDSK